MDLLSFSSLYESCERLDRKEKFIQAWTLYCCTQGSHKNVKDFAELWQEEDEKSELGRDDFLKDFGKGF